MLKFIFLTGDHQGDEISLKEGQEFNKKSKYFEDLSGKILVSSTQGGDLKLVSTKKEIESGGENLSELLLYPGLLFSIAQVGISVQENNLENDESSSYTNNKFSDPLDLLAEASTADKPESVVLLENPLYFKFVRGPLLNEKWKIIHSPTAFGVKSPVYFFIEPEIKTDKDFLHLNKKDNQITLSSPLSKFIKINGHYLESDHVVSSGDLVEFSQTAFYIKLR